VHHSLRARKPLTSIANIRVEGVFFLNSIGLSMIVKNESHSLRACLESVRDVVTEIVIADTGSTDNTCDIAREFGATVVSFPWQHHYAKARNAALQPITTEWVLVLDADEELDRDTAQGIEGSLNSPSIGGFTTPIRNYVKSRSNRGWDRIAVENDYRHARAKDSPAFFIHENCRLFRRRPDIFFTGRVHELVEPQIVAASLKLAPANFFIHHFGHLESGGEKAGKGVYYRDLLRRKIEEEPTNPAGWVQLALQEYEHFRNQGEALYCLQRALELEPRAAEAWLFLAMIYVDAGRFHEALAALDRDTRKGASVALSEQVRGDALHSLNRLEEARAAYGRAMKVAGCDPLLESKLGYIEVKLGHRGPGFEKLLHAAHTSPTMFAVQDRLMKAYIMAGNLRDAAGTAERVAEALPHPKTHLRAASLYAAGSDFARCLQILKRALANFPDSSELQQAYAEASRQLDDRGPLSSISNLVLPTTS
jgi:tetratricopeptide (TPR) repeat protein